VVVFEGGLVGAGGQLATGARLPGTLSGSRQSRGSVQSAPQLVDVQSLHQSTAREHCLRCLRQRLHRRPGACDLYDTRLGICYLRLASNPLSSNALDWGQPVGIS